MLLWQCPHPREFLDEIFEILQKGERHVVIHLPYWRMEEFNNALYNANKRYRYPLDFPVPLAEASPYENLRQCALKPEDFFKAPLLSQEMQKENIVLSIPSQLSFELQEEWLKFMAEISSETRQYQESLSGQEGTAEQQIPLPWRLLILAPAHFPSPKPETSLEIFLGSGLCTQSDLEYAIENCVSKSGIRNLSSRLWLEAICKGLGMRDVGLCSFIFRELPLDMEEIMAMLRTYPLPELDYDTINCIISLDDGSEQIRDLWRERQWLRDIGILESDCRNRESLHPAALARANRPHAIKRLLVEGQIRIYLPMVQEIHNFIYQQLSKICGDDWHKRYSENYSGMDMEIGPLANYMSTYLKGECGEALLELAYLWRDVRHTVAHSRFLDYEIARDAVDLYEALR